VRKPYGCGLGIELLETKEHNALYINFSNTLEKVARTDITYLEIREWLF